MKKIIRHLLGLLLIIGNLTMFISCDTQIDTPPENPDTPTECKIHMDDDSDGICDICNKNLKTECSIHMDDNEDGICDVCGKSLKQTATLSGYYELSSKTVANADYMGAYLSNYLYFNDSAVDYVTVDYSGKTTKNGIYTLKDNKVTIKFGIYEYEFSYNQDNGILSFNGMINKKKVQMVYTFNDNYEISTTTGDVNFTDLLFGEDLNENYYNYCPTILMEGNDTMHIWYCGNGTSGNVTDYIMYRQGKLTEDGKWTFSEKQVALSPSSDGWDSRHCCDPSVVKGNFSYGGESYSYLMAYLGCYTSDCTINMVGLAVAKTANGPWVKVGTKAFCNYEDSNEFGTDGGSYWGYGQPSLVSVDKSGKVMLFYTKGIKLGTFTYMEEWDLSSLDDPQLLGSTKLADGGNIEVLNNADFAYDPVENRIYCLKEDHPYPSNGGVTWISGSNSLFYVSALATDDSNADCLLRNHSWAKVGTINSSSTGYQRNHNCGILTDEYGWIINYEKIPVVYTSSDLMTDYPDWQATGQWPALHTYRLHGYIMGN